MCDSFNRLRLGVAALCGEQKTVKSININKNQIKSQINMISFERFSCARFCDCWFTVLLNLFLARKGNIPARVACLSEGSRKGRSYQWPTELINGSCVAGCNFLFGDGRGPH